MKRKIVSNKFSVFSLISSGVFLCVYLIVRLLAELNVHLYLFGLASQEISSVAMLLCIVPAVCGAAVLLYKNIRYKIIAVIISAVPAFGVLLYSVMLLALASVGTYFEYTSDDKTHEIVVNECSFLLGGWGEIYEKTSFCTMKQVGEYTTDDGYMPFTQGAFYFVWNENDFELHYNYGAVNGGEYRTVKMEYAG